MITMPAVLRAGLVEIEHDRSDDEVRIKYFKAGVCLDYLKRTKKETFEDFVQRVIAYVTALKL